MSKTKSSSKIKWLRDIILIASAISGLTVAASYTGIFQFLELSALDRWFRYRSLEQRDDRIVVVTIGESDIDNLRQWPMNDLTLSKLITKINKQQPKVIGLDIYRNLPVEPGYAELEKVLRSSPNVIGVEKAVGQKVSPSPILEEQGQVGLADLVVDVDGKIRRSLLSIELETGEIQLGLATRSALMYLIEEGVELEAIPDTNKRRFGKGVFTPLRKYDGGYVNVDAGGFQVLLNYRGTEDNFDRISLTEVLNGNITEDLFKDRIVFVGSIAESLNDLFATPYNSGNRDRMGYLPGVFVHANIASQILSSAIDGRKSLDVQSEPVEWFWVFLWTLIGSSFTLFLLERNSLSKEITSLMRTTAICLIVPGILLFGSGYLLFLSGWWIPVVTPLCSTLLATITVSSYYNQSQKKLAFIDGLTQIANRRFFDEFLQKELIASQNKEENLSVLLFDVDFFKKYNDTYGHQAGDKCLEKVAQALAESVRKYDLAARYGGEEFVAVLPKADSEVGKVVAQRICDRLRSFEIPHESSGVSDIVSVSCGIASTDKHQVSSPEELIAHADRALYQAKEEGRDRFVVAE